MNKKELMEIQDRIINPLTIINFKCESDPVIKEQIDKIVEYINSIEVE